jgi:hypothetical protein
MYLAPFNYDRFFERVFKHTHIAKRFLEDMLNVEIEEIEPLPRKNKITDDAAFVEFDYRCKIKGNYVIVDMQQWYKQDVVKRFYLYFCNNTSLQLESIKPQIIPLTKNKQYKTKNYEDIEPAITIIWMADDNLGFVDDIIAFTMLPELFSAFIKDETLWANKNIDDIVAFRNKLLAIAQNDTKNLSFLSKNRLLFALQGNIVLNHKLGKNENLEKCIDWFLFAEKTKNKDNKPEDFESFKKEPIMMEVIELLKTSELTQDDFEYITDYDAYKIGVENYEQSVIKRAGIDLKRIESEKERIESEKERIESEFKLKLEESFNKELHQIEKLLKKGDSLDEIADLLEIDLETLQNYMDLLPKQ